MAKRGIARKLWNLLRSSDTGVVLLLGLSVLFGVATLVRETVPAAYEQLFGDDLRFFLDAFRVIDLWFWIIATLCLFLGLSLATCAIDRVTTLVRVGSRDPRDVGTILLHLGVGIAMFAHLIDGLGGSAMMVRLDDRFRTVGEREIRVLDGDVETNRDGSVRSQRIWLESRHRSGPTESLSCAPNDPASWNGGGEILLLLRLEQQPRRAVFRIGGEIDTLGIGMQRLLPDGGLLVLERLFGPPEFRIPVARVRVAGGTHAGTHLLGHGMSPSIPDVVLRDLTFSPVALVNHRKAPGTPLLLAAVFVLSVGCILIAASWLRLERKGLDLIPRRKGGAIDESEDVTK